MSSILGFIARFIDEKLSAARVLSGLLLITLVTNGSLLLAQYGPPSGFDAPMPLFDAALGPEESGEPVPNGGALVEGRSSMPPPLPSGIGRPSTVTRASGTLVAGDAEGGRDSGSTSNESFTLPQSTELLGAVSSSDLPSVLRELVPDDLEDLLGRGALNILGGEDAQADEDSQGGGGPQGSVGSPADEGSQGGSRGSPVDEGGQGGSRGSPANEGAQGGNGAPPSSVDPPASGVPQGDEGPQSDGGPKGDGASKGNGGPKDGGSPQGGGETKGGGGPKGGGGQ